jgi:hypothetical protein
MDEMQKALANVNDLRAKVLRGEKLTTEECRETLLALRSGRAAAAKRGAEKAAKVKVTAANLNLDDLFKQKGE